MGQPEQLKESPTPAAGWAEGQAGYYVYCIVPASGATLPDLAGIEGRRVHAVVFRDLSALVHLVPPWPSLTGDSSALAAGVLAHHRVVEAAWQRWGGAVPLAFNTLIKASGPDGKDNLVSWLAAEYPSLKRKLEALTGKVEYGVQMFWNPLSVAQNIAESDPDVMRLAREMEGKPRGLAYMYRQRLERLVKQSLQARGMQQFQELYARLERWTERIRVDQPREVEETTQQMVANLSCLVCRERCAGLELALRQEVSQQPGLSLRLVGPLPPYSFC